MGRRDERHKCKVVESGALTQTLRYGAEFYQSKNFNKPNNNYPEKVNNYSIYAEDALNFSSLTVLLASDILITS